MRSLFLCLGGRDGSRVRISLNLHRRVATVTAKLKNRGRGWPMDPCDLRRSLSQPRTSSKTATGYMNVRGLVGKRQHQKQHDKSERKNGRLKRIVLRSQGRWKEQPRACSWKFTGAGRRCQKETIIPKRTFLAVPGTLLSIINVRAHLHCLVRP